MFFHVCRFKNKFLPKIIFRNTIRVSNILDSDQKGPYIGSNHLQMLSTGAKITAGRERVK